LFCEFKNPDSIANEVTKLLENDKLRREMEKKAYRYSRNFIWPKVAQKICRHIQTSDKRLREDADVNLPSIKLDFLRAITDDTGIFHIRNLELQIG